MTDKPIKAKEGQCNHYTGIWGPGMVDIDCCEAGVNYRQLAGTTEPGWGRKLPCTRPIGNVTEAEQVPCPLKRLPTQAEIDAWDAYIEQRIKLVGRAMKRCREQAGGKRGVNGTVECPACNGKLHYSIAGSNGHLWGRCETEDCLSWMQ